jgi:hypothetical protein
MEEKLEAMRLLTEHLVPGRWEQARSPSEGECKATTIARVSIIDATVSERIGMAADDKESTDHHYWAGLVPIRTVFGPAIPRDPSDQRVPMPEAIKQYSRSLPRAGSWSSATADAASSPNIGNKDASLTWFFCGILIGSVAMIALTKRAG